MLRFDNGFLRKLEYLRVVSRRAFMGHDRADRIATKRGRGLEFADHRQYSPGDDVRHIDWKAYKRLNRLLLRLFDEEQDLSIYLFLDASQSMANDGKFEQAKRIAAALCYIGLVHLDRVTIVPFGARLQLETVAGRGRARIFQVFAALDRVATAGQTSLVQAFTQFASTSRPRGLAIVISDFLDPAGIEAGLKVLSRTRHDVCAVYVTSAQEPAIGALGEIRCVDAETGEVRDIDVTAGLAKAYREAWQAHALAIEQCCKRWQVAYVRANAEDPLEDVMLRTFRQGGFVA